jgi:hypothetical protein
MGDSGCATMDECLARQQEESKVMEEDQIKRGDIIEGVIVRID